MARSRLKRVLVVFAILALSLGAVVGTLWQLGVVQSWFEKFFQERLVREQIRRLQPKLPFVIETFEIDSPWRDFVQGRIRRIAFVIRYQRFRVRVAGPLAIHEVEETVRQQQRKEYAIEYDSKETTIEPVESAAARSSAFAIALRVQARDDLSRLTELGVKAQAPSFEWRHFGVTAKEPLVDAEWRWKKARTDVSARQARWAESTDRNVTLERPSFHAEIPFRLEPFEIGTSAPALWKARSAELNWDGRNVLLPLDRLPFAFQLDLESKESPLPKLGRLKVGVSKNEPGFEIAVTPRWDSSKRLHSLDVKWDTNWVALAPIWKVLLDWPETIQFETLAIPRGRVKSSGHGSLPIPMTPAFTKNGPASWLRSFEARVQLRDFAARWPDRGLAVSGVDLDLPVGGAEGVEAGRFSARDLWFRRFHARLEEMPFRLAPHAPRDYRDYHFELPAGVPLRIDGVPLRLGRVHSVLNPGRADAPFELHASAMLDPMPLEPLVRGLCGDASRLPPAKLSASFPEIEVTSSAIEPQGGAKIELFDGSAQVRNLGLYDPFTAVPELDFDAEWKGIRLDRVGEFLNFGKMWGGLQGYAKGVTIVGWLPTNYDFRVEVATLGRENVVFSGDAMKSFVKLFSGASIDQMPGIAQWIAFGGWSRWFGYDIDYAGISAYAKDGSILVETLDPHEDTIEDRRQNDHYILFGRRIRMPIVSAGYPLVIDAPGISNFVRHMMGQLQQMAEEKAEEAKKNTNDDQEKNDEKKPAPCLPPEI